MPSWTHLIRFQAVEDDRVHLGQLVDTTQDVGIQSLGDMKIKAFKIQGDIFDANVTENILTVDKILSPLTRDQCTYIRCLGLNYKDHAAVGFIGRSKTPFSGANDSKEGGFALPSEPEVFTKSRTALIGPYPEAITIAKLAQDETSDYEAELCVVIGKTGRDIPEDRAMEHVLGYTASNDISARALQLATKQWSFGKGLDNSCPIGPVLVSPSALANPHSLKIEAIYNGKTVQEGHTGDMIFSISQQVSLLSRGTTLEAGSIILTGTPAGIGYFRTPRVFLEDGSQIRVHIERIGTLVNNIKYD